MWPSLSLFLYLIHYIDAIGPNYLSNVCTNKAGQPQMCYPPFSSAAHGRKVVATNTCGLTSRQKYCIDLSSSDARRRCEYCDNYSSTERHPANYLTESEENVNKWWQSETLSENKNIHYTDSVNLTLNLGTQFYVTYVYLKFKSPRPPAMIIYRKFDDKSDWTPWQYFSRNCWSYFRMHSIRKEPSSAKPVDKAICTEDYSDLNKYYGGIVIFSSIKDRPGSDDFFNNPELQKWATASQIRIELKRMHTFGDEGNAETQTLLTYFFAVNKLTVGARCICNGHGNQCNEVSTLGGGSSESKLVCVCDRSHHTKGSNCGLCADGYEDVPWKPATTLNANPCRACNCSGNSRECFFDSDLYIKSGNRSGGHCSNCKNNTVGAHCELCLPGFAPDPYLPTVCIPCGCDPTGSLKSTCDKVGQCVCKPGVGGRYCNKCMPGYFGFGFKGCNSCNCSIAGGLDNKGDCDPVNGLCKCKKNVIGDKCDKCYVGYFGLNATDPNGCQQCFCFSHTSECTSAKDYILHNITSDFSEGHSDDWTYRDPTLNTVYNAVREVSPSGKPYITISNYEDRSKNYILQAPYKFLNNLRASYNQYLELEVSFHRNPSGGDSSTSQQQVLSFMDDINLVSSVTRRSLQFPFNYAGNPQAIYQTRSSAETLVYRFRLSESNPMMNQHLGTRLFLGTLNDISSLEIRLSNFKGHLRLYRMTLMSATRLPPATRESTYMFRDRLLSSVEKCTCPKNYMGDSCETCSAGFRRVTVGGSSFDPCVSCECNNNAASCEPVSGVCQCEKNTAGPRCERCKDGYYGDAINDRCRSCNCPNNEKCALYTIGDIKQPVCMDCLNNRMGIRCMECADGYYGDPSKNIECKRCQCNDNIDYFATGNCDGVTGKCLRCINNAEGDQCETCRRGFYGNALKNPADCKPCRCERSGSKPDAYGLLSCNKGTGVCNCQKNVRGAKCDQCYPEHYGIESGQGCSECQCDPIGSWNNTCSNVGMCACKPGIVGLKCDTCKLGFFKFTSTGCTDCKCDVDGSYNSSCNEKGLCFCRPNIIGDKCNQCKENHFNLTVGCTQCPACYGMIQERVKSLKDKLQLLNSTLGNVKPPTSTGNTDLYHILLDLENLVREIELIAEGKTPDAEVKMKTDELKKRLDTIIGNSSRLGDDLKYVKKENKICDIDGSIKTLDSLTEDLDTLFNDLERNGSKFLNELNRRLSKFAVSNEEMSKKVVASDSMAKKLEEEADATDKIFKDAKDSLDKTDKIVKELINKMISVEDINAVSQKLDAILSRVDPLRDQMDALKVEMIALNVKTVNLNNQVDNMGAEKIIAEVEELVQNISYIDHESRKLLQKMRDATGSINDATIRSLMTSIRNTLASKSQEKNKSQGQLESLLELQRNLNKSRDDLQEAVIKARNALRDLRSGAGATTNSDREEAIRRCKELPKLKIRIEEVQKNVDEIDKNFNALRDNILTEKNLLDGLLEKAKNLSDTVDTISNERKEAITNITNQNLISLKNKNDADDLKVSSQGLDRKFTDQNALASNELTNAGKQSAELDTLKSEADVLTNQLNDLIKQLQIVDSASNDSLTAYENELNRLDREIKSGTFNQELNILKEKNQQAKGQMNQLEADYNSMKDHYNLLEKINASMVAEPFRTGKKIESTGN